MTKSTAILVTTLIPFLFTSSTNTLAHQEFDHDMHKLIEKNPELAHRLLNRKILITQTNKFSQFPIHTAAKLGHYVIVSTCLSLSSELAFMTDIFGDTPFHTSAKHGQLHIVTLFLDTFGGLINEVNKKNETGIHQAAREGHDQVVRLLLSRGAKITLTSSGKSPTELALQSMENCAFEMEHNRGNLQFYEGKLR